MDEKDEQFEMDLAYYMEIGAVNLVGMNDDGEAVYEITELAKELAPELWEAHVNHVDNMIKSLYQDGLIDVEYDENLTAYFRLNKDGMDILKDLGISHNYNHYQRFQFHYLYCYNNRNLLLQLYWQAS